MYLACLAKLNRPAFVCGNALLSTIASLVLLQADVQAASGQLSREQLLVCLEREDALRVGIRAHEALVAQHTQDALAIEAEDKHLEALRNRAMDENKAAHEATSRRIDALKDRVVAFAASSAKLEVDAAQLNAEVSRYNEACSGRTYDVKDKKQALVDYQERKRAAPAAGFEAGLKAFDQGNHAEALRHWLLLAEQGRAAAQFNVAHLYEQGLGTDKDEAQAARWFVAAAKSGVAAAQLQAGSMYETGQGVTKDLGSASYWYGEAANSKSAKDADFARQARDRLARLPEQFRMGSEDVIAFDGGRFVLRRAANKECVIALQGEVTRSANFEFGSVIRKAKAVDCARPLILLLESPGGSLDAGLALARHVRAEGMRTIARYECASSCANIFLGGSERVLWGSRAAIGLHQASSVRGEGNGRTITCVTARDDPSPQALRRHLRFVVPETAEEIIRIVMATPCTQIEWVKGSRALDLQVATRIEAPDDDVFGPRDERTGASPEVPR